MKKLAPVLAALVLFTAAYLTLAWKLVPGGLYDYDECDYVFAARFGWLANAFDSPSQSIVEFLEAGWRQYRNPIPSTELSAISRAQDDVNFYRHRHGPVHIYWLALTLPFSPDEQTLRRFSLAAAPLAAVAIAVAFIVAWPGPLGSIAAILAAAFFLLSPVMFPIVELAPHVWFAAASCLMLVFLGRAAVDGDRRFWYAAVVSSGIAFCALEVAFVPILVLIAIAGWQRRALRLDGGFVLRSTALLAATVLVLWPGAILRLSVVKAYLFMAYLAIARRGAWGEGTLGSLWLTRLGWTPLEWLLIAGAVLLWIIHRKTPIWRALFPSLLFAALMIAATLRVNSAMPRYSILFFSALQMFAALAWALQIHGWQPRRRWLAVGVLCAALAGNAALYRARKPDASPGSPRLSIALTEIRNRQLNGKRLLVPQEEIPTLHYYLPGTTLHGYLESEDPRSRLQQRAFDAILYRGMPVRLQLAPMQ